MAEFITFIADFCDEIRQPLAVIDYLKEWTNPIAVKAGYTQASFFYPQYEKVTPQLLDYLVYIIPFPHSVLKKMSLGPNMAMPNSALGHGGLTIFVGGETGSEVYVKTTDPKQLAGIIFHEMMHNKLQMNNKLHDLFKKKCALSCEELPRSEFLTGPTSGEVDLMAPALKNL